MVLALPAMMGGMHCPRPCPMKPETVTPLQVSLKGTQRLLRQPTQMILEQQSLVVREASAGLQVSSCSDEPWSATLSGRAATFIIPLEVTCLEFSPPEDDVWRLRGSLRLRNKDVRANRVGHGTHGLECPDQFGGWVAPGESLWWPQPSSQ